MMVYERCGGLVYGSARLGFESRAGASPQGGLMGGRSLSEYVLYIKSKKKGWLQVKKKFFLCHTSIVSFTFSTRAFLIKFFCYLLSP